MYYVSLKDAIYEIANDVKFRQNLSRVASRINCHLLLKISFL